MDNNEEILNFIARFQNEGTIHIFTHGCCYWFAKILDERFNMYELESGIFYNEVDNHFATLINFHLYDITGDLGNIKDLKGWDSWKKVILNDYLLYERIYHDCIKCDGMTTLNVDII